jgi:hypothetical protein
MRRTRRLLSRAQPLLGALLLGLLPAGCSDPTAPALPKITSVSPAAGALAGSPGFTSIAVGDGGQLPELARTNPPWGRVT